MGYDGEVKTGRRQVAYIRLRRICDRPRLRIGQSDGEIVSFSSRTACGTRACPLAIAGLADLATRRLPSRAICRKLRLKKRKQRETAQLSTTAHYAGSAACQFRHSAIYERWRKTYGQRQA